MRPPPPVGVEGSSEDAFETESARQCGASRGHSFGDGIVLWGHGLDCALGAWLGRRLRKNRPERGKNRPERAQSAAVGQTSPE